MRALERGETTTLEQGGVSAGVEKDQGGVGASEYDDKAKGEAAGESVGLSPKLGLGRF